MKFLITKEQLSHGLQAVQNVVSPRSTLPILSNVLLRAEGEKLHLTATDLDITVVSSVAASVVRAGAITLPAKRFAEIVRELNSAEVQFDVNDKNVCTISAGPAVFKMAGLPAEEFPPLPNFGEKRRITLQQEALKDLLNKTSYAISADETRFVLNGILMSLRDHSVTLVATDGRRLALAEEQVEVPPQSLGECIIPTKAINELNRLLAEDSVDIRLTDNQVEFNLGSTIIISKLIEGTYPNYKQVIPQETKERVAMNREELLGALRRARIMTNERSNSVKLTLGVNQVSITANTQDVGELHESFAVRYTGREFSIAFNPEYLMDPLKALNDEEVYLELIDELSPGLLKIKSSFLYVLMPMRMS